ncbi:hypothetical protein RUM43_011063 [Polyplax serrata]|uniref:Translation initiation factor eIF2B subunit epsilon n=1 Tax=Polyplax serrata TaxID=468196 RepID=A0AAN8P4H9_POLSC
MSNLKKLNKNIEKEDLLQAVVVADDFEGTFSGFTHEDSSVLLPIANIRAVDYALECLGRCGFQEAILFCSNNALEIKEYLKNSAWSHPSSTMAVTVVVSEKCQSLGDVLRDLDGRAVIKGDFVLLSAFTVSNLNLVNILNYHRQLYQKDKGAAMTLVLQDVGSRVPPLDNSTYVVNAVTNRVLMHVKDSKFKKFEIPLEYLNGNVNINIHSNLVDTGITICSQSVPLLLSDNFDFQTKEDLIRGLLLNEEILDSRIYFYLVENGYGCTIKNWRTFQRVNLDCIHRWTFPLVPDQFFANDKPFSYQRHCIYKQPGVQLVNSVKLEMDVVVGANSLIGHNSVILRSVIGKNCSIGENVFIRDCYLFDGCIVKDNGKLELSVIGENSKVGENSTLRNCFIKKNVNLKQNTKMEDAVIAKEPQEKNWKEISPGAFFIKIKDQYGSDESLNEQAGLDFIDPEAEYCEVLEDDDLSSVSDDKSYMNSPEPDDTTVFYTEVVDSLQRGFEEKLSCDNLILEINSSRYAYNVMLSDVTVLTFKGILLVPSRLGATLKAVLSYFLPLLKNYVKTSEAQMNCLELLEEICDELGNELAKSLHFLYDNDIISEDAILEWHKNLSKGSPVIPKVAPLIKWLNEAAEESSSEEESS